MSGSGSFIEGNENSDEVQWRKAVSTSLLATQSDLNTPGDVCGFVVEIPIDHLRDNRSPDAFLSLFKMVAYGDLNPNHGVRSDFLSERKDKSSQVNTSLIFRYSVDPVIFSGNNFHLPSLSSQDDSEDASISSIPPMFSHTWNTIRRSGIGSFDQQGPSMGGSASSGLPLVRSETRPSSTHLPLPLPPPLPSSTRRALNVHQRGQLSRTPLVKSRVVARKRGRKRAKIMLPAATDSKHNDNRDTDPDPDANTDAAGAADMSTHNGEKTKKDDIKSRVLRLLRETETPQALRHRPLPPPLPSSSLLSSLTGIVKFDCPWGKAMTGLEISSFFKTVPSAPVLFKHPQANRLLKANSFKVQGQWIISLNSAPASTSTAFEKRLELMKSRWSVLTSLAGSGRFPCNLRGNFGGGSKEGGVFEGEEECSVVGSSVGEVEDSSSKRKASPISEFIYLSHVKDTSDIPYIISIFCPISLAMKVRCLLGRNSALELPFEGGVKLPFYVNGFGAVFVG